MDKYYLDKVARCSVCICFWGAVYVLMYILAKPSECFDFLDISPVLLLMCNKVVVPLIVLHY